MTRTIAALVALALCMAAMSASAQITAVTASPPRLTTPPDSTEEAVLSYGLGFPFQVAPTQAALLCNVRVEGIAATDFENGTDVIVFDDLATISPDNAVAISRNERTADADGAERIVLKFPVIGGFVPLGALRTDGTPHPAAGTGFGLCQAISVPLNEDGSFTWGGKNQHRCEVHRLSYDGERFEAERTSSGAEQAHPVVGVWQIISPGLTNAIPDGDEMLQAVTATDGGGQLTGVVRWSHADGDWQMTDFSPVTPRGQGWAEPSLVRDRDGSLLFTARGSGGDRLSEVRVWRRAGDGSQWQLVVSTDEVRVWQRKQEGPEWGAIIDLPGAHNPGPISIGRAADGTPYIGANLLGSGRETLCIWPLNAGRMDLKEPIVARAARDEFGPAPDGGAWMVDHPSGAVLRLADGGWHGVVAYRILGNAEHRGAAPAPQSGCYVEEVLSSGPVIAPWRFE